MPPLAPPFNSEDFTAHARCVRCLPKRPRHSIYQYMHRWRWRNVSQDKTKEIPKTEAHRKSRVNPVKKHKYVCSKLHWSSGNDLRSKVLWIAIKWWQIGNKSFSRRPSFSSKRRSLNEMRKITRSNKQTNNERRR